MKIEKTMKRKIFSLFVIAMFVFEIFAFAYALDSENGDPYADTTAYDSLDVCDETSDYYDWCECNHPGDPNCGYYDDSYDYVCTIDADYSEYGICPEGYNINGGANAYECLDDGFGNGYWSDYLCSDYGECNIGETWGLCGDFASPAYTCDDVNGYGYGYWSGYLCKDCSLSDGENEEVVGDGLESNDGCYSCANGKLDETGLDGCDYSNAGSESAQNSVDENWNYCSSTMDCSYSEYCDENSQCVFGCESDADCDSSDPNANVCDLVSSNPGKCVASLNEGCFWEEKNYAVDDLWYDNPCSDGSEHTWTCVGNDFWVDNDECSYISEATAPETCTNDGENWIGENNKCMQCIGGEAREVVDTLCVKSCEKDSQCTDYGTVCDNNHCLPGCRGEDGVAYSEEERLAEKDGVCKQCFDGEIMVVDCSGTVSATSNYGELGQSCLSDKTCNGDLECDVLNICNYPSDYDCRASGCSDGGECNSETGKCDLASNNNDEQAKKTTDNVKSKGVDKKWQSGLDNFYIKVNDLKSQGLSDSEIKDMLGSDKKYGEFLPVLLSRLDGKSTDWNNALSNVKRVFDNYGADNQKDYVGALTAAKNMAKQFALPEEDVNLLYYKATGTPINGDKEISKLNEAIDYADQRNTVSSDDPAYRQNKRNLMRQYMLYDSDGNHLTGDALNSAMEEVDSVFHPKNYESIKQGLAKNLGFRGAQLELTADTYAGFLMNGDTKGAQNFLETMNEAKIRTSGGLPTLMFGSSIQRALEHKDGDGYGITALKGAAQATYGFIDFMSSPTGEVTMMTGGMGGVGLVTGKIAQVAGHGYFAYDLGTAAVDSGIKTVQSFEKSGFSPETFGNVVNLASTLYFLKGVGSSLAHGVATAPDVIKSAGTEVAYADIMNQNIQAEYVKAAQPSLLQQTRDYFKNDAEKALETAQAKADNAQFNYDSAVAQFDGAESAGVKPIVVDTLASVEITARKDLNQAKAELRDTKLKVEENPPTLTDKALSFVDNVLNARSPEPVAVAVGGGTIPSRNVKAETAEAKSSPPSTPPEVDTTITKASGKVEEIANSPGTPSIENTKLLNPAGTPIEPVTTTPSDAKYMPTDSQAKQAAANIREIPSNPEVPKAEAPSVETPSRPREIVGETPAVKAEAVKAEAPIETTPPRESGTTGTKPDLMSQIEKPLSPEVVKQIKNKLDSEIANQVKELLPSDVPAETAADATAKYNSWDRTRTPENPSGDPAAAKKFWDVVDRAVRPEVEKLLPTGTSEAEVAKAVKDYNDWQKTREQGTSPAEYDAAGKKFWDNIDSNNRKAIAEQFPATTPKEVIDSAAKNYGDWLKTREQLPADASPAVKAEAVKAETAAAKKFWNELPPEAVAKLSRTNTIETPAKTPTTQIGKVTTKPAAEQLVAAERARVEAEQKVRDLENKINDPKTSEAEKAKLREELKKADEALDIAENNADAAKQAPNTNKPKTDISDTEYILLGDVQNAVAKGDFKEARAIYDKIDALRESVGLPKSSRAQLPVAERNSASTSNAKPVTETPPPKNTVAKSATDTVSAPIGVVAKGIEAAKSAGRRFVDGVKNLFGGNSKTKPFEDLQKAVKKGDVKINSEQPKFVQKDGKVTIEGDFITVKDSASAETRKLAEAANNILKDSALAKRKTAKTPEYTKPNRAEPQPTDYTSMDEWINEYKKWLSENPIEVTKLQISTAEYSDLFFKAKESSVAPLIDFYNEQGIQFKAVPSEGYKYENGKFVKTSGSGQGVDFSVSDAPKDVADIANSPGTPDYNQQQILNPALDEAMQNARKLLQSGSKSIKNLEEAADALSKFQDDELYYSGATDLQIALGDRIGSLQSPPVEIGGLSVNQLKRAYIPEKNAQLPDSEVVIVYHGTNDLTKFLQDGPSSIKPLFVGDRSTALMASQGQGANAGVIVFRVPKSIADKILPPKKEYGGFIGAEAGGGYEMVLTPAQAKELFKYRADIIQ